MSVLVRQGQSLCTLLSFPSECSCQTGTATLYSFFLPYCGQISARQKASWPTFISACQLGPPAVRYQHANLALPDRPANLDLSASLRHYDALAISVAIASLHFSSAWAALLRVHRFRSRHARSGLGRAVRSVGVPVSERPTALLVCKLCSQSLLSGSC